jgi:hypothetical protein
MAYNSLPSATAAAAFRESAAEGVGSFDGAAALMMVGAGTGHVMNSDVPRSVKLS